MNNVVRSLWGDHKPGIRKSNPRTNREACQWAWKCEWKWNGRFYNHVNLTRVLRVEKKRNASSDIVPVRDIFVLYALLFQYFFSPFFYRHYHFLFLFTADLSGHNVISCVCFMNVQCVGCRVHVLKINAIIRLESPSFEYMETIQPKAASFRSIYFAFAHIHEQNVIQFINRYSSLQMDDLNWNLSQNKCELIWNDKTWPNTAVNPPDCGKQNEINIRQTQANPNASRNQSDRVAEPIVVNNNAKWFKSDDGKQTVYEPRKRETEQSRRVNWAESDLKLHIKRK